MALGTRVLRFRILIGILAVIVCGSVAVALILPRRRISPPPRPPQGLTTAEIRRQIQLHDPHRVRLIPRRTYTVPPPSLFRKIP
jgi:hypothetical protein